MEVQSLYPQQLLRGVLNFMLIEGQLGGDFTSARADSKKPQCSHRMAALLMIAVAILKGTESSSKVVTIEFLASPLLCGIVMSAKSIF